MLLPSSFQVLQTRHETAEELAEDREKSRHELEIPTRHSDTLREIPKHSLRGEEREEEQESTHRLRQERWLELEEKLAQDLALKQLRIQDPGELGEEREEELESVLDPELCPGAEELRLQGGHGRGMEGEERRAAIAVCGCGGGGGQCLGLWLDVCHSIHRKGEGRRNDEGRIHLIMNGRTEEG